MTPEQRHRTMQAIRGRDTKPEVFIAHLLFAHGMRYRKHTSSVPGHPDLFFRKYNTVIFINGCFWHHHEGCQFFRWPQTNISFWHEKLERNRQRDLETKRKLEEMGIRQLVIWECTIKRMKKDEAFCEDIISQILNFLMEGSVQYLEL